MTRNAAGKNPAKAQSPATSELSCEVCGQMPEPTKTRLTLANIAVMLPIELLVHAAVVGTHLPYVAKVLVLTMTATILVIWVAEPSAARMLRGWLHAPALRHRKRLDAAPALWRARTVLKDRPGSLQKLTQALAGLETNILSIHVHPVPGGVLDEFVLSAPWDVRESRTPADTACRRRSRSACLADHGPGHGRRANGGAEPGRPDRRQPAGAAAGRRGTAAGQDRHGTRHRQRRGATVRRRDGNEDPYGVARTHHLLAAR